jgi:surface protein
MGGMFYQAVAFNQEVSSWNVASVSNMYSMFNSATVFNQNLARWNVLRVNAAASVTEGLISGSP